MEWISIKDKLPKEGKRVLCISKGNNMQIGFELHGEMYRDTVAQPFESCGYIVTHWMELPKPPKQ